MFTGVYEQSFIAHAMFYATCLGPAEFAKNPDCTSSASFQKTSTVIIGFHTLSIFFSQTRNFL
jgi:hypothetical protein